MKCAIAVLVAVAGLSAAAHGQVMRILVSRDGVNFSPQVQAYSGQTVQVLVTMSYTGSPDAVAGFGRANFQPVISSWRTGDTLLPLLQGGNTNPSDGSGMIAPQFYTGISAGSSTASYGHIHAAYAAGTYGRVLPMGRTYLTGADALTGFVHVNPDGTGDTYLRIAQASNTSWIGGAGNTAGGSGVNCAQLYTTGRTLADPDFWGNREVVLGNTPQHDPALDYRLQNVELFRFAFTLENNFSFGRDMIIDAPIQGQQLDSSGVRYAGYFTDGNTGVEPALHAAVTVQTAIVHVNLLPTPASLMVLGLGGLVVGRRRSRVSCVGEPVRA